MNKPKPIQLSIPHPCRQSWDEMTPDGQGRHCAHCQKTVIDFTTWSDTALYKYFANYDGQTCGRLLATQLNHPIQIPHQPHSRLYRMTIALGLTLLFTQTPDLLAQTRPPITNQMLETTSVKDQPQYNNSLGSLAGCVSDDKKEVLINATVQVFQNNILKGGAITDFDGKYRVDSLSPGIYDVIVLYQGYDSFVLKRVIVSPDATVSINATLRRNGGYLGLIPVITGYIPRMIDQDNPTKTTITSEQLNHMPR